MDKILRGVRKFHDEVFPSHREFFEQLAEVQRPRALFITCSDSRVHPNLITQTEPGDLFILRNPGNIVPPFHAGNDSEAATIEYAVEVLEVVDIIICGHSNCGAMTALLKPNGMHLPAVSQWLHHAEGTRRIIQNSYSELPFEHQHKVAVEKNVLVQMDNLRTHPAVAARMSSGGLALHAWVYDIPTGEVNQFNPQSGHFESLVAESKLRRRMLEAAV
jgi:carbonic anhydrase